MEEDVTFELRTEFITLDALLKAAALASSGGAAKQMILEGQVRVDGAVETRRGRKLRPGQRVTLTGQSNGILLCAAPAGDAEGSAA